MKLCLIWFQFCFDFDGFDWSFIRCIFLNRSKWSRFRRRRNVCFIRNIRWWKFFLRFCRFRFWLSRSLLWCWCRLLRRSIERSFIFISLSFNVFMPIWSWLITIRLLNINDSFWICRLFFYVTSKGKTTKITRFDMTSTSYSNMSHFTIKKSIFWTFSHEAL